MKQNINELWGILQFINLVFLKKKMEVEKYLIKEQPNEWYYIIMEAKHRGWKNSLMDWKNSTAGKVPALYTVNPV